VIAEHRDVFQQESDHALTFSVRRLSIAPEPGEVGGQGQNASAFFLAEQAAISLALAFVLLLILRQRAEFLVSIGLQGIGHQAVRRVHMPVTALGQLSFIVNALHLGAAEAIRFLRPRLTSTCIVPLVPIQLP
jgi:hypothetical protein